jgi:type IV secretion system protein VirB9
VDLTIYLEPETIEGSAVGGARATWVRAEQLEDFRAQAELAREQARRALETAQADLDREITDFRTRYPLSLHFAYRVRLDATPFFVRAMYHDDHRTFIQSTARELPALYEVKDGKPSLVAFEVQDGTYVVPKILDDGYLMIGSKRLGFRRLETR